MSTRTHNPIGEQNSNESKMYPEDYEWLGIIYQEDVRLAVAFITPLAVYNNDIWHPVAKTAINKYFPNNGKAAIFSRDFFTAKVGQICCFRPEPNQQSSNIEKPYYSCYMVNKELMLAPCVQVFNWTSRAKDSLDIPNLLEEGIPSESCFSRIIYIRHQNYVYGPIKLEIVADRFKPKEYVQSTPKGGPPLLVSVYKIAERDCLLLNDGKSHLSMLDEAFLAPPVTKEDWSLPQTAIKQALHAIKGSATTLENIQFSDNRIRELARLSSKEGPEALKIEEATLKRAQFILKCQMERLLDIQALIEDLQVDHPLLKAAREQEVRLRHAKIAQEAEEQIYSKKDELQKIQSTIQEAKNMLVNLQKDAEAVEQRRDQALELEREIQKRLTELREEPLQVLADLHIAASLLPLTRQSGLFMGEAHPQSHVASAIQADRIPQTQQQSSREGMLKWIPNNGKEILSNNIQDLTGTFSGSFAQQHDVNSGKLKLCASALLAGCIPSISGLAGTSLLRAIAHVIANKRMWTVPVPLTALSPLDLFGKIDAEKRMFIPTVGNLADIILQAKQNPQELAIVLLEGIDRAPIMPVAVPLLRQYIQLRHNNTKPAPLSLFHPLSLAANDPYLKLAQFTWPDNILLAVTVDDDAGSFHLPEILEHWLARIDALPKKTPKPGNAVEPSFVPFVTWQGLVETIRQKASKNSESERIIEQRMLYEILTTLNNKELNPDKVINDMWPLEEDDEDR